MTVEFEFNENNLVDITVEDKQSNLSTKMSLSISDYVDLIDKANLYRKSMEIKVFDIPTNAIAIKFKDSHYSITFLIKKRTIFLRQNGKVVIWNLPNIVCECSEKGDLKFWAVAANKINNDSKLYSLHLPHFYYDGSVCYGSFSKRSVSALEMESYALEYLTTSSTHDINPKYLVKDESKENTYNYKISKKDNYRLFKEVKMEGANL